MLTRQAEIYEKLITMCIEQSNCVAWNVWGFSDAVSQAAPQNPALWDNEFIPKKAQEYVLAALQNADRSSVAVQDRIRFMREKFGRYDL